MAGCVLEYSQWRETPSSPTSELREGGDVKDMSTEASLFFHRIASGNYSDPLRIERQVTLEQGAPSLHCSWKAGQSLCQTCPPLPIDVLTLEL